LTALIGHHMIHSDVSELTAMLQDAGFTDVEEVGTRHTQLLFVRGKTETGARGG
jgi:hypothetical protein